MEEGNMARYVVMEDGVVAPIFDVLGLDLMHKTWDGMTRCEFEPAVVVPEYEFDKRTKRRDRKLFDIYTPLIRVLQKAAEPLTVNDIIKLTNRPLREEKGYLETLYKSGWVEKVGKGYAMPDSFRNAVSSVPCIV